MEGHHYPNNEASETQNEWGWGRARARLAAEGKGRLTVGIGHPETGGGKSGGRGKDIMLRNQKRKAPPFRRKLRTSD